MEDLIRTFPDAERAKSLLEMVDIRMKSIKLMEKDRELFAPKIIEEYYESILELITAIMSVDGYKTRSDATGAHIISIEYVRRCKELNGNEIELIKELRKKRIGIKYYGHCVGSEYLKNKEDSIKTIISKLKIVLAKKL
jgi:hypothetical protein